MALLSGASECKTSESGVWTPSMSAERNEQPGVLLSETTALNPSLGGLLTCEAETICFQAIDLVSLH